MAGGEPRALGAVYKLRVGHPSGTLSIKARLNQNPEGEIQAEYAVLGRSARVLMEGAALLRPGVFSMEK
jgi:2-methylaconitate cis-trans-isomerase PrpF